ncbi:DUF952 domain-containing protein [Caulobacter sp. DWR2-3-1b2]|uniref:DUF952 domain-containing protein n=1 Tax=unclassified Caulobacter TaxID=2648921 RepID=UPI0019C354F6|nr:DUF952 domain-containing protein [Caulobacter sp.]
MSTIYKLLSADSWAAARAAGAFEGSAVDLADGFIHFSSGEQAQETAAKWFAGQDDLLLLTVEIDDADPALRWEASRGGALFPHLYRPLRTDEVTAERPLALDAVGAPIIGELSA